MLDLSPEKILALLTIGMVVIGPQRLPAAARSLAKGLSRARQLADSLTQPVHASLHEPRQMIESAIGELRTGIESPLHSARETFSLPHAPQAGPEAQPLAAVDIPFDPTQN